MSQFRLCALVRYAAFRGRAASFAALFLARNPQTRRVPTEIPNATSGMTKPIFQSLLSSITPATIRINPAISSATRQISTSLPYLPSWKAASNGAKTATNMPISRTVSPISSAVVAKRCLPASSLIRGHQQKMPNVTPCQLRPYLYTEAILPNNSNPTPETNCTL